ncbi:MAG: tetratricopeptide repeat protein [Nitrospinae bacterium]|nr:tetratricopeptide repeat protein [Nitrospinota bacterium]
MPSRRPGCPYCGAQVTLAGDPGGDGLYTVKCAKCGNLLKIPAQDNTTEKLPPPTEKVPPPSSPEARARHAAELHEDGTRLLESQKFPAAVTKFRAASDKAPDNVEILSALAHACSRANMAYDALAAYKRILDIDPDNREALLKTGMLYIQLKRPALGAAALHRLLEFDPGHEQARLMLEIATAQKKDEEKSTGAPSATPRRDVLAELAGLVLSAGWGKTGLVAAEWILPLAAFVAIYQTIGSESVYMDGLLAAMFLYCVFLGVVAHELGHGAAALMCGDRTALNAGRLSLDPLRHLSFLGTIAVPALVYIAAGVMFGWAKPVPFDPMKMDRHPRDLAFVAGMGPFASFASACVSFTLFLAVAAAHNIDHPEAYLRFTSELGSPLDAGSGRWEAFWFVALEITALSAVANLIIGAFNLIPLPPLDGGWLLKCAAPRSGEWLNRLMWPGAIAVIGLIYSGFAPLVFYPVYVALAGFYFVSGLVL